MRLSEDIKNLNITDKFIVLEELWNEMSKNVDESRFTPDWHLEVLSKREEDIKTGKSKFIYLDEVKKRLMSR